MEPKERPGRAWRRSKAEALRPSGRVFEAAPPSPVKKQVDEGGRRAANRPVNPIGDFSRQHSHFSQRKTSRCCAAGNAASPHAKDVERAGLAHTLMTKPGRNLTQPEPKAER